MNFGTFQGPGPGPVLRLPIDYRWWHDASVTWITPYAGVYEIWACGGGGSGGASLLYGTGGGGGGIGIKRAFLSAGQRLTITIGAGGAGCTANDQDGNDGGTTTVVGGPINMSAFGGKKGIYNSTKQIQTLAGGAGGSATGADVVYVGGAGGSIDVQSVKERAWAGGGAANIKGLADPPRGGNCTLSGSFDATTLGGGAGIGGNGGDASATSNVPAYATGGGAMRAGVSVTNATAAAPGPGTGDRGFYPVGAFVPWGGGFAGVPVAANANTAVAIGVGTSGYTGTNAPALSFFAGTGGHSNTVGSGRAAWGGGTGGGNTLTGQGGDGWVFISWVQP